MIESIKVSGDNYTRAVLMFRDCKVNPRMNLLFGGNGAGKTTFIKYITKCVNSKVLSKNLHLLNGYDTFTLYSFSNSENNYNNVGHSRRFGFDIDPGMALKKYAVSSLSEGQGIIYSLEDFLYFLENNLPYKKNASNVITIDEMDSGLSVDNIEYVMKRLNKLIETRDDIQMFISFNNYATCEFNKDDIISMYTGKSIKIKGYKQFKYYLNMNRDKLLAKRKNNQFTGEILY